MTCLLRNPYVGQEATVRTKRGTTDWFQIGLIGKDSDAGRDCGKEEKGRTEDEMAGWHH